MDDGGDGGGAGVVWKDGCDGDDGWRNWWDGGVGVKLGGVMYGKVYMVDRCRVRTMEFMMWWRVGLR